ncbi:MAG: DMT family transporter [Omnitrophica WOR_2 bacterium]
MKEASQRKTKGIYAAVTSALFLGFTPVFGKLSILFGMPPLAVVAFRTLFACILLFIVVLIYNKKFLYIYPAGLLGCLLAGSINGTGSLLFYSALGRLDASIGQIIYSLYPLFVMIWLSLDHQLPGKLTVVRLLMVIPALYLLIGQGRIDLIGVGMMLLSAALYALHLPINQRVLYDMPAPTVTLYTLFAMSLVVMPVYLISHIFINPGGISTVSSQAWGALLGLTLVTFFSRLTLFMGVKHLGGLQTALLGLGELLVTVLFSHLWLNEKLSPYQWLGFLILVVSLSLVIFEKPALKKPGARGWLNWLRPAALPEEIPVHTGN